LITWIKQKLGLLERETFNEEQLKEDIKEELDDG